MTRLKRKAPKELLRTLKALEAELRSEQRIIICGGAALAIGYDSSKATTDIDTFNSISNNEELKAAIKRLKQKDPILPPIDDAAVAAFPDGFEDRLKRVNVAGLRKLIVLVPERHDLAISKILRGSEHDLQGIEGLHKRVPLTLDELFSRFVKGVRTSTFTGSVFDLKCVFLTAVERLWGEAEASRIEEKLDRALASAQ